MTDWDRLTASQPVDRKAAIVTSESAEPADFRWQIVEDPHLQDGPHPVLAVIPNRDTLIDLTGQKIGRLTIRGVVAGSKASTSKGTLWAVRCDCSRYTAMRNKTLKRYAQDGGVRAMCIECDYAEQVKAGLKPPLAERLELRSKRSTP